MRLSVKYTEIISIGIATTGLFFTGFLAFIFSMALIYWLITNIAMDDLSTVIVTNAVLSLIAGMALALDASKECAISRRAILAAPLALAGWRARAQEPGIVSAALILAMDVSGSVTLDRYKVQIDGIAAALESPRMARRVDYSAPIALMVMQWSGALEIWTSEWFALRDRGDLRATAASIRSMERRGSGSTGVAAALARAREEFQRLPFQARALILDVSGDGVENVGPPASVAPVRDSLVEMGVTINALPIVGDPSQDPRALTEFYRDQVIGGPHAFLHVVARDADFAHSFLRKIVLEIAGIDITTEG